MIIGQHFLTLISLVIETFGIDIYSYDDPVAGPRKIPKADAPFAGLSIVPDSTTFNICVATGSVKLNNGSGCVEHSKLAYRVHKPQNKQTINGQ